VPGVDVASDGHEPAALDGGASATLRGQGQAAGQWLRDVTRYRRSLVRDQTREKQRLEKVLEDAQIKLDAMISDLHGVSGRNARRRRVTLAFEAVS
jgi:hypothetical protein